MIQRNQTLHLCPQLKNDERSKQVEWVVILPMVAEVTEDMSEGLPIVSSASRCYRAIFMSGYDDQLYADALCITDLKDKAAHRVS